MGSPPASQRERRPADRRAALKLRCYTVAGGFGAVIDDIAVQTGLLALNAGIEAARAGDSGRGFAVVATEIRALAQRSAHAAREVKALIASSTEHVGQGVELVGRSGEALARIVEQITEVARVTGAIASSTGEQSTGLDQITVTVRKMDRLTQQNAAMVREASGAASNLETEARELAEMVAAFHLGRTLTTSTSRPNVAGLAPRQACALPERRAGAA